jgi:hypothetical protein
MSTDLCIHVANVLYLASYLCRDILWLRVLTCAGLGFGIAFFCAQTEAMFTPAAWMGVFLMVNLIQIGLILRERQAMRLLPDQREAGRVLMQRLTREDMLNVLTKSLCEGDRSLALLDPSAERELHPEQKLVRDLAFNRLSDQELMNLIIRRFWRAQPKGLERVL